MKDTPYGWSGNATAHVKMSVKDSMIATTALVHGLIVATRNQKDFKKAGIKAFDPFEA